VCVAVGRQTLPGWLVPCVLPPNSSQAVRRDRDGRVVGALDRDREGQIVAFTVLSLPRSVVKPLMSSGTVLDPRGQRHGRGARRAGARRAAARAWWRGRAKPSACAGHERKRSTSPRAQWYGRTAAARLQAPAGPLRVCSTHVSGNACQLADLGETLAARRDGRPLVLMGDLNSTPGLAGSALVDRPTRARRRVRRGEPGRAGLHRLSAGARGEAHGAAARRLRARRGRAEAAAGAREPSRPRCAGKR
jgi:hypothetical protein